jgi:hypothetical protein
MSSAMPQKQTDAFLNRTVTIPQIKNYFSFIVTPWLLSFSTVFPTATAIFLSLLLATFHA